MKKYVFITFSIINAGGSQLYIRNKAKYLQKQGYAVYIFSAMRGPIIIEELKQYSQYIIPDIAYFPQIYSKKKLENILNQISTIIRKNSTDIIIESHSLKFGLWGELLARMVDGRHLLYSLEESNSIINEKHLEFAIHKWQQKAFIGITPKSLPWFFDTYNIKVSQNQINWLPAYCNNPVEDIPYEYKLPVVDFNICLMGRLNKEYMKPSALSIARYVKSRPLHKFNIVIIGGGDKQKMKEFTNIFRDIHNGNVFITGFLSPIPYEFFTRMDVVVTSAGCCRAAWNQGLVVVSIDGHDLKPIGIYNHTTQNTLFRDNEPCIDLSVILDDILIKKHYVKTINSYIPIEYDFSNHINFIKEMECNNKYFPIESISLPLKVRFLSNLKRLIYKIIGFKNYEYISRVFLWKK